MYLALLDESLAKITTDYEMFINPLTKKIMEIKIINKSNNPLPEHKTAFSSGMDLIADLGEDGSLIIEPFKTAKILTGIHIEIPCDYEGQVRPRSGLSLTGLIISFGTIDSDYRGEIGVICTNLTGSPYMVCNGERIAQLVIAPVEKNIRWLQVNELEETTRGCGGFGHTGN